MPDFRVADTAPEHPKLRAAGLAAVGLWATAGAYAMRELTDGWVPEYWVLTWPSGKAQATKLVTLGMWSKEKRGGLDGYRFHDWLDYQRPASKVHEERAKGRERAQRSRERSGARAAEASVSHDADVRSASHDSLPLPLNGAPVDHLGASPERANSNGGGPIEIPFPEGWAPNDGHQRTATRKRIDLTHQAQQFEAHARAHGRTAVDWDAAFTVWLGSSKPVGPNPWATRGNGTDDNIRALLNGVSPNVTELPRAIGGGA